MYMTGGKWLSPLPIYLICQRACALFVLPEVYFWELASTGTCENLYAFVISQLRYTSELLESCPSQFSHSICDSCITNVSFHSFSSFLFLSKYDRWSVLRRTMLNNLLVKPLLNLLLYYLLLSENNTSSMLKHWCFVCKYDFHIDLPGRFLSTCTLHSFYNTSTTLWLLFALQISCISSDFNNSMHELQFCSPAWTCCLSLSDLGIPPFVLFMSTISKGVIPQIASSFISSSAMTWNSRLRYMSSIWTGIFHSVALCFNLNF